MLNNWFNKLIKEPYHWHRSKPGMFPIATKNLININAIPEPIAKMAYAEFARQFAETFPEPPVPCPSFESLRTKGFGMDETMSLLADIIERNEEEIKSLNSQLDAAHWDAMEGRDE